MLKTKVTDFAKSLDPNETDHNELPHQDLFCLPSSLLFLLLKTFNKFTRIMSYYKSLTLVHSKQPKLHRVLAVLSAVGLTISIDLYQVAYNEPPHLDLHYLPSSLLILIIV